MPIELVCGNVLTIPCDVLVLKHAGNLYGADAAVVKALEKGGIDVRSRLPGRGECLLVQTDGLIVARHILFVGTIDLWDFNYENISELTSGALVYAAAQGLRASRFAFTLHGVNVGLDESEAFQRWVAAVQDAVQTQVVSSDAIFQLVDYDTGRINRLTRELPRFLSPQPASPPKRAVANENAETLLLTKPASTTAAPQASAAKPRLFVTMPFSEDMDDIFHYAIQNAAHSAGFICERADKQIFTGDIKDWMFRRIASADLVIAELSGGNPNCYLEVGYAWGCGRRTLLLVRDIKDLKFDVQGHKCLVYSKIMELEEKLFKELSGLRQQLAQ